jgi:hypothetical protein
MSILCPYVSHNYIAGLTLVWYFFTRFRMKMNAFNVVLASAALLVNFAGSASAQGVVSDPQDSGAGPNLSASANSGSGVPFGLAFTPQENMTFDSVSLWLANYTVNEFYGDLKMNVHVSLYGPGVSEHYTSLVLNNPFSGTTQFDFANPTGPAALQANQEYYLELSVGATGSADAMAQANVTWVPGGSLGGNVTYDGLYTYLPTPGFSVPENARYFEAVGSPNAFSVNPVPEPSTFGLMGIAGAVLVAARLRRKQA